MDDKEEAKTGYPEWMGAKIEDKAAEQTAKLEMMIRPLMSNEAQARLSSLKAAHPKIAARSLAALSQRIKAGKTFDDREYKEIVRNVQPKNREIRIRRA